MQLPNKLYSYRNSTFFLLPKIMKELTNGALPVKELYRRMKPHLSDATDFLSAMDCLYAIRAVDLNDEGEIYIC